MLLSACHVVYVSTDSRNQGSQAGAVGETEGRQDTDTGSKAAGSWLGMSSCSHMVGDPAGCAAAGAAAAVQATAALLGLNRLPFFYLALKAADYDL